MRKRERERVGVSTDRGGCTELQPGPKRAARDGERGKEVLLTANKLCVASTGRQQTHVPTGGRCACNRVRHTKCRPCAAGVVHREAVMIVSLLLLPLVPHATSRLFYPPTTHLFSPLSVRVYKEQ